MDDEHRGRLEQAARALATGSEAARAWVRELAAVAGSVASEAQSLAEATRRAENLARKLAASASRRNCVGVFGPSQAGKSYLVSVLARRPQSTLTADFAGLRKNFISEINPAGDRESTGLVTRFTVQRGTDDATHPVELRLLAETDLVKILGNSFLSDFDPNQRRIQPPDEDTIRAAIARAEPLAQETVAHLDEITMFDVGEYFRTYFPTGVDRLNRAGYWEALTRLGHRLPLAARAELYAVVWGGLADFTRLFLVLARALERLAHAPEARVTIDALTPREKSIIDVETLTRLGKPEDEADALSVVPVGARGGAAPAKIPRAVLTALIAEVKIVMTEQPWSFFDHTDLLDFPGARSREKQIDLPSDPVEREDRVRNMLLRGKIAFLFQRYTEERELTSMLLCMPPSNQEVKDLAGMVKGWVEQTHGDTPARRAAVPCALFLVLTKFDMDFIEKAGDTTESRRTKFDRRLDASFLKLYGHDDWVQDWDGKPFRNSLFLRNPGMKQTHLVEYASITTAADGSEQLVEQGPNPAFADKLVEYREAFLASEICGRHFGAPAQAWEAAFMPNDGGVSHLVHELERVLHPGLKAEQISGRLADQGGELHGRLRRFYRAEDDGSRKQKEEALLALRRRLAGVVRQKGYGAFLQYLASVMVGEIDVREAFLNVAALRVDAPPPAVGERDGAAAPSEPDPWDDPWAEAPAGAAASAPAPLVVQHDRAALFANQVLNLWTEKVRAVPVRAQTLAALGFDAKLASDLGDELVVGAHRARLGDAIAAKVREQVQAAHVRWEDVADRASGIAAACVDDYVAWLGYGALPPDARPGFPEPPKPRERPVFAAPPLPASVPALEARRRGLESEFFVDWGVALRQLGAENATYSGGREIDPEQNRRLGEILAQIGLAAQVTAGASRSGASR